jgi:hypothetical protein
MKVKLTSGLSFTGQGSKKFNKGIWYEVEDEYGLYLLSTGRFAAPNPGEDPPVGGTPVGSVPGGVISMIGEGKDAMVGTIPPNTGQELICVQCNKKFKNKAGLNGHMARKHGSKENK